MKTKLLLFAACAQAALGQTIYQNVQRSGLLTATRIPIVGAGGIVADDADLTFATDTLTFTKGITTLMTSGVGSAAAPSYTFTGDTDTGFFWQGINTIGVAVGGVKHFDFEAAGGNGYLYGTGGLASLMLGSAGQIALAAAGTNQSITLTPSGTGVTSFVASTSTGYLGQLFGDGSTIALYGLATATARTAVNYAFASNGANAYVNSPTAAGFINFSLLDVVKARIAGTTGNLLLGGLTTDGTGVLQLAAGASDKTSGIGFVGGTSWLFATSANSLTFLGGSTTGIIKLDTTGASIGSSIQFATQNTIKWDIGYAAGSGSGTAFEIYNRVTSANALTFASATSNATFTGAVAIGGGTAILRVLSATATLNFGSILAAASEDLTITVTGAAEGDTTNFGLPATVLSGAVFNAWVSATNTVTIRCNNAGAVSIDPASATYRAEVIQH